MGHRNTDLHRDNATDMRPHAQPCGCTHSLSEMHYTQLYYTCAHKCITHTAVLHTHTQQHYTQQYYTQLYYTHSCITHSHTATSLSLTALLNTELYHTYTDPPANEGHLQDPCWRSQRQPTADCPAGHPPKPVIPAATIDLTPRCPELHWAGHRQVEGP